MYVGNQMRRLDSDYKILKAKYKEQTDINKYFACFVTINARTFENKKKDCIRIKIHLYLSLLRNGQ
jgi:hypothetical protein